MAGIDRRRVQQAFTLQAGEYDSQATVQKRVIARLAGLLCTAPAAPRRILDIGSGTGTLIKEIHRLYPATEVVGVDLAFGMSMRARINVATDAIASILTADAETLPFRSHAFDVAVSSSTFQWLESLDRAFAEAFRVLAPGGRFIFALFGEHTLFELRSSYRSAWEKNCHTREERTHSFHTAAEVKDALGRAGFVEIRIKQETELEQYRDVTALLRSLRGIGAGNAALVKGSGFAERRIMLDMMDIYRRKFAAGGLIPATYEVI